MTEKSTGITGHEGLDDIIDQIIQGAMKASKGSVDEAINILKSDLQRKIDSQDADKADYSMWYYIALSKLRGDDKE